MTKDVWHVGRMQSSNFEGLAKSTGKLFYNRKNQKEMALFFLIIYMYTKHSRDCFSFKTMNRYMFQ